MSEHRLYLLDSDVFIAAKKGTGEKRMGHARPDHREPVFAAAIEHHLLTAIALHHGLDLVTGNTAHFQRVQQLGYPVILALWRI